MMSNIKGANTKPELFVRKLLHRRGFRYRLHNKNLPGKPDLVFPKHRAVVFVNGCFWHGHGCHIYKMPSTRKEFWQRKISANRERDQRNLVRLSLAGWKTLVVWECAITGKEKLPSTELLRTMEAWLYYDPLSAEMVGRKK